MKNKLDFHHRLLDQYVWDMDGEKPNSKNRRKFVSKRARMATKQLVRAELEEYWENEIMKEINDFLYGEND